MLKYYYINFAVISFAAHARLEINMLFVPSEIKNIIDRLNRSGFECFLVGGCVRDALLGLPVKDYDLTTSARPEEVIDTFSDCKVILNGLKHGTVTLIFGNYPIEITTYRIDKDYSDGRRPDSVAFTRNLSEDLARRDFTMNAICYHPNQGIIDPYGGIKDIQNKIIRSVGNPARRFEEDALRILRALRFSSVLGFSIEENTSLALFYEKKRLKNISAERIFSELKMLLCGTNIKQTILNYFDVFSLLMPEIAAMKDFEQNSKYHIYDVLTHTLIVVENVPPDPVMRLAALFHDIGKPECYTVGKDGRGHFYGHQAVSVEISTKILTRLKCGKETQEKVLTLIKHHDEKINADEKSVKRFLKKVPPESFFDLLRLKRADILAQNPDYLNNLLNLDRLEAIFNKIIMEKQCFSLKDLAVNGSDLINNGFAQGKEVGSILNSLLEKVISGEIQNDYEKLIKEAIKLKAHRKK